MKNINLIVDVGNSTTRYGLFHDKECISYLVLPTHYEKNKEVKKPLKSFWKNLKDELYIDGGMIFSVSPNSNQNIYKMVKKVFKRKLKIFDWENYEYSKKSPEITDKIGADLIADLVATSFYYGSSAIIFDLGTVSKMLVVDNKGIFVGASFVPGIASQLSLFEKSTALLPTAPAIDFVPVKSGINTTECMKHGVYWSLVSFIMHEKEAQEQLLHTKLKLILTGGNVETIQDSVKVIDKICDPILTLKGMNILYQELKK